MQISFRRLLVEGAAVFATAFAFLLALAPTAPFTRELGVCESGAVRDVLAGNIILPHFIPGPMVHVPPFYWWTAALAVHALGWSEIALRMPSMIAAALTCAIVFGWATVSINRRTAFWAAASLMLCHFFLDAARQPRMDSLLMLWVTVAAVAFERALQSAGEPSDCGPAAIDLSSRRIGLTVAALTMGLGILTKGILGILLPGLVAGLYLVVRQRWRNLFRIDLIATFFFALSIGLSWYMAGYAIGGQKFLQWQLAMNLWSRFLPATAGGADYCAHPFWYFAPHTLAGFIPWSVYLPAFTLYAWPRSGRVLPAAVVFTLCWFIAIFVFFSTSHGKCLVYILPAFPPLAVMTGIAIDGAASVLSGSRNRASASPDSYNRAFTTAFAIGSAVVATAALAIALAAVAALIYGVPPALTTRLHPTDRRFLEIFAALATRSAAAPLGLLGLIAWISAFVAGDTVALIGLRRRDAQIAAAGVFIIAAGGSIFWFAVMNRALAQRETLRDFARAVARTVPPGSDVAHLGMSDCDLNFYSPQPLTPIFRLTCDADAPRFVVARQLDFAAAPGANRSCFTPILKFSPDDSNGPRVLLQRRP